MPILAFSGIKVNVTWL